MTNRSTARGSKTVRRTFRPSRQLSRASLLFGTALGCSIAILAATPEKAFALDECGAVGGDGQVTCDGTGNPYPTGIDYVADPGDDLTVTIEGDVVVTTTSDGVTAVGDTNYDVTIDVETGASITADGFGLYAGTDGTGNATITTDAGVTINAGLAGIYAYSQDGDTVVDTGATVTVDGDANPFFLAVGVGGGSDSGSTTITTSGDITVETTTDYYAIGILSNGPDLSSVTSTSDIVVNNYYVSGSAYGILSSGQGNSLVTQTGDVEVYAGLNAYGVVAVSANTFAVVNVTGNVDTYAYLGNSAAIIAAGDGGAEGNLTGDADVYAFNDGFGILLVSGSGDTESTVVGNITVQTGSGDAFGIQTDAATTSDVYVTGNITVTAGIDADYYGNTAYGLDITSVGASETDVVGNITVVSNDSIAVGVDVYSGGDMDIDVEGTIDISSQDAGWGVFAYSTGGANIVIETNNIVVDSGLDFGTGAGAGTAGGAGIQAYTDGVGATIDISAVNITTTGDNTEGVTALSLFGEVAVFVDNVTTTGTGSEAIYAAGYDRAEVTAYGLITTNGDYSPGVVGVSVFDVDIATNDVVTNGQSSIGIYGYSFGGALGDGSVEVTFDTVTTNGDAVQQPDVIVVGPPDYTLHYYAVSSHGIVAVANTGSVSIVGGDVTTNGDGANGIIASGFGSVTINVDDVTTTGGALQNFTYTGPGTPYTDFYRAAYGIDAFVFGGDLSVTADTVTTSGYEADGIVAVGTAYYDSVANTYVGDTTVVVRNVTTSGEDADGIFAANYGGNATVVVTGTVSTSGIDSDGVTVAAIGYYDSLSQSVLVGNAVASVEQVITTGDNSYGVIAVGGGGNATVFADDVRTYGDGSTGIYVLAANYYDSGQLVDLHGDARVYAESVFTDGDFADGIRAIAEGGNVVIGADDVVTNGDFSIGIVAVAEYYTYGPGFPYDSGNVTVNADNVTTNGDFADGIVAIAEGGSVVVNADDVMVFGASSSAIVALSGGLDVNNVDHVDVTTYGDIYSADGVGILVDSADFATVHVESASNVDGFDWGIQVTSAGGAFINNEGFVTGGSGRAIDVDGAAVTLFNDASGTVQGFVDLTDNADLFDNEGLFEAYGTSSFGLDADTLDNDGIVGVNRDSAVAATVTFTGLETFRNDGTVDFRNNHVNDVLSLPNTTFVGVAGSSLLRTDTQLAGPGSASDRLVLGGTGNATGVTEIIVNDLSGPNGILNFGGILVVDSNSNEVGTEFFMDTVQKGFVDYELIFDPAADNWLIFGLPSNEAFELIAFASGSQDFWRRSGDAWGGRMAEIRDAQSWTDGGPRREGWELWMQTHIGDEDFENLETYSFGGFTFAEDLSTHSDWRGFQFGFDNLSGGPDSYSFWGLTMGFTEQETRFEFSDNSFEIEGWNVGAYMGWNWGGLYLNGLLKGDFFELDANFTSIPTMIEIDGTTWGAKGELGYRWDGGGWFFEPHAELAWTTTDLDSFSNFGANVDYDDADSLLGKAGARLGTTFGSGSVVLSPYVGAYWVEEFEGENSMDFSTGGLPLLIVDQARDSYGQVDVGFTTQTFYGLEGFMKGEFKFGDEADGWTFRTGARWRW